MGRHRPGKRNYHRVPKRRRKKFYQPQGGHPSPPPRKPAPPAQQPPNQDVEPSVLCGLVRRGAQVEMAHEWDNKFKIDGLVKYILHGPADPLPIGLQLTQSIGNTAKIHKFVEEASKFPGIGPLLYAEVVGAISRPMLTAMRDALLALWSDPVRKAHKSWRVTVYHNGNIQWFRI